LDCEYASEKEVAFSNKENKKDRVGGESKSIRRREASPTLKDRRDAFRKTTIKPAKCLPFMWESVQTWLEVAAEQVFF